MNIHPVVQSNGQQSTPAAIPPFRQPARTQLELERRQAELMAAFALPVRVVTVRLDLPNFPPIQRPMPNLGEAGLGRAYLRREVHHVTYSPQTNPERNVDDLFVERLRRGIQNRHNSLSGGGGVRRFAFTQLLTRTFEGAVAAAKSIRDNLPEGTPSEKETCSVCRDEFSGLATLPAKRKIVKLECDHQFHKECILPWLEGHNSCPNCRHLMESDDPEWNRANRAMLEKAKTVLGKREGAESAPSEKRLRKE